MSSASAPRAVLLDLDGTLLDTAADLAWAANRVRADEGQAPLAVARIAQFVGKGTDVLVQRALTDDMEGRFDGERFLKAKAGMEQYYREANGVYATVFPGVVQGLQALRAAGLRLGCVTNKPRQFTIPLLQKTGLLEHLDVAVAGDDVARRKPHPDLVLEACRRLEVAPAAALLIGDSQNDAQAAHAAGSRSVMVETGYNEGEPVQDLAGHPGVCGVFPTLLDAANWTLHHPAIAFPS